MVESFTIWLVAISTMCLLTVLTVAFCIKTNKDMLSLGIRLAGVYILTAVALLTMVIPINTTYIDGETVDNIVKVSYKEETDKYEVETAEGKRYTLKEGLSADNTFISFDCKVVTENIYGIKMYTEKDIIFVNKSDPEMSESEKHHVLDRVVQK